MNWRKLLLLLWLLFVGVLILTIMIRRPAFTLISGEWICTHFVNNSCTVMSKL
jgi:hypothetical protein